MRKWLLLFVLILLTACGSRDIPAPVSDLGLLHANPPASGHRVKRGETLYSIAFMYDTDYKSLAKINNIKPPYTLTIGQLIHFKPQKVNNVRRFKPQISRPQSLQKPIINSSDKWFWPVRGTIKSSFAPFMSKKGIDIASKKGTKVHAAQGGIVAYAGSGLENYGNLIIIKHKNDYLTAYGNNARNIVKEGQYVTAGQVIAEVGIINHKYYGLHFEIRKNGKPQNPMHFRMIYLHNY